MYICIHIYIYIYIYIYSYTQKTGWGCSDGHPRAGRASGWRSAASRSWGWPQGRYGSSRRPGRCASPSASAWTPSLVPSRLV